MNHHASVQGKHSGLRVLPTLCLAVIVLTALLLLPWFLSAYWITIFTNVAMLAILAQSWNIIAGFTGYPAFGNVAFFGVGAYSMGILTAKYPIELPYLLVLTGAGLIASLACVVVGGPLMRVRGHYFAIGTIGLAVTFQQVTYVIPQLTTDVAGTIILPSFPGTISTLEGTAYLWMLGVLLLCTAAAVQLSRSRFGFGLKAIRADEEAATTYGVPVVRLKLEAWAVSAFFTGLAGAVWATWIAVITPPSAYDLRIAVQYSVMTLLGGLGTVIGPLLGALALGTVSQVVGSSYPTAHLLLMGVIVMLTVLVIPDGFMGLLRRDLSRPVTPLMRAFRRGAKRIGDSTPPKRLHD